MIGRAAHGKNQIQAIPIDRYTRKKKVEGLERMDRMATGRKRVVQRSTGTVCSVVRCHTLQYRV